ncbi:MAG: hypothetical protein M9888_06415 [Chitinophagales bacterium]|nr:hypothetical protein [Chitinophagales bacterium]
MKSQKLPIAIAATFLWLGFVGAISFMESWLKFQAPGISVPLGLGIGRLVFGVLNKIEWVLAISIFFNLYISNKNAILSKINLAYFIVVFILIIQTIWLLPALDARAETVIGGGDTSPSTLHYWFIGMEVIKAACLIKFGVSILKKVIY